MIDHFDYDAKLGAEDHAAVLSGAAVQSAAVLPGGLPAPVLFRGIGLSVSPDSETVRWRLLGCCCRCRHLILCCCCVHLLKTAWMALLPTLTAVPPPPPPPPACLPACLQAFLVLAGSATAYSGKPGAGATEAKLAGGSLGLVALAQMRNNARVAVAGSLHMLSDAAFAAKATSRAGKRCGTGMRIVWNVLHVLHAGTGSPGLPGVCVHAYPPGQAPTSHTQSTACLSPSAPSAPLTLLAAAWAPSATRPLPPPSASGPSRSAGCCGPLACPTACWRGRSPGQWRLSSIA